MIEAHQAKKISDCEVPDNVYEFVQYKIFMALSKRRYATTIHIENELPPLYAPVSPFGVDSLKRYFKNLGYTIVETRDYLHISWR
jgi:hypothetical protein